MNALSSGEAIERHHHKADGVGVGVGRIFWKVYDVFICLLTLVSTSIRATAFSLKSYHEAALSASILEKGQAKDGS